MPYELNMPQLSDTMTEGTLVKWNKAEGDAIKSGEEIADVETDKATMPMESAEAGTLAVMLVKEGAKVPVGDPIGVVALKGEKVEDIKAKYTGGAKAAPAKAEATKAQPAAASSPTGMSSSDLQATGAELPDGVEEGGEVAHGDHPHATQQGRQHRREHRQLHERQRLGRARRRRRSTADQPARQAHRGR